MFRKHKKGNGDWSPDSTAAPTSHRAGETPEAQMKIIRTHIAAQAGEIGNLATEIRTVKGLILMLLDEARDGRPTH